MMTIRFGIRKLKLIVMRILISAIFTLVLGIQNAKSCSCIAPSSFCESVSWAVENLDVTIARAKVLGESSSGREIEIEQIILGEFNNPKIELSFGRCDLYAHELTTGDEFIIAFTKLQDRFRLISCAISFLKIEDDVIQGKIAPGVSSLEYDEFFNLESCESIFGQINLEGNLGFYPNPTKEAIRLLNAGSINSFENLEVQIFDALGNQVDFRTYSGELFPKQEWIINVEDFTIGLYIIRVSNQFQEVTFKMIKV